MHTGVDKDPHFNSVITPIYPTSTFRFDALGRKNEFDYTRTGNPTRRAAEENIAALEGGVRCVCTSTGMSAIVLFLHLLKSGDHVITGNDIYGGTYRLMADVMKQWNVEFSFVNMRDLEEISGAFRSNTKAIWIETPSNPLMNLVDIEAVSKIGRSKGALVAADNTFLSPYLQKPFELGVDLIVHSTTKYINGYSDVVGGAVIANSESLSTNLEYYANALGIGEAPFDAWLVLRGVKTLSLRMEKHCLNAQAIAEYLDDHPRVARVYYPGLPDHPQHDLAKRQMTGFGGMLSFDLHPGSNLNSFFEPLKLFSLAESLGGVESLIEAPWHMSHSSMNEEARRHAGIVRENVRVSVGIEDKDDLIEDLEAGLTRLTG